jgi:hypothetical protein
MLAGEVAITDISSKLAEMKSTLESGVTMNSGFSLLLRLLERTPPYTEKHVALLEQELQLARQQLHDLCHHRQEMYVEAQKLESVSLEY